MFSGFQRSHSLGRAPRFLASDGIALTKHTPLIDLRWPTLAVCMLLPGCPLTDNYFIDGASAGSGQALPKGGASELDTAGASSAASGPDASPDATCSDRSGAGGMDANYISPDAGRSDAGSNEIGGDSPGGAGASPSVGGAGGSAGAPAAGSGAAGTPSNLPDPACGEGVVKGTACSVASAQFCYKSCGPDNVGYKRETCVGGAYDELQSGCTFPAVQDYSCYELPASLPAECPSGVPRGGRPCQIAECKPCFGGSIVAPQYQDSTGAQKPGYCVCSELRTWTCGSIGSWPCPDGQGCY